MTNIEGRCIWCQSHPNDKDQPWSRSCPDAPDRLHWSASDLWKAREEDKRHFGRMLREANHLLLNGARATRALSAGRKVRREVRQSCEDASALECHAAKISDTVAIRMGGPSLPVGPHFEALESDQGIPFGGLDA